VPGEGGGAALHAACESALMSSLPFPRARNLPPPSGPAALFGDPTLPPSALAVLLLLISLPRLKRVGTRVLLQGSRFRYRQLPALLV